MSDPAAPRPPQSNPDLPAVQRWMQCILMHPGGVAEGVGSSEARRHLDISLEELPQVIRPSQALSSADRLEIYVNAYHARLMECLDEEFSVTRWAIGPELFAALTFGYLRQHPSRSYTLGELGARFPGYLAETRLHERELPAGAGPTWADFVIELAAFERTLYEVYDGPGTETTGTLDAQALARLPADDWQRLQLVPAASLRLLHTAHDVSQFWSDRKDEQEPAFPGVQETFLAISRLDYVVERRPLSAIEFALLERLCAGDTVPAAIAAASTIGAAEAIEQSLGTWFRQWTSAGYFAGFGLSDT